MITKDNFPQLLTSLHFTEHNNIFTKHFELQDCTLQVDVAKQELLYPEKIKIGSEYTNSFEKPENFVVFECVHRLLEKGYLPQHIELEPKWKVGHGASGGRADILVKSQNDKPLLLIECKTAGQEFNKAWKYMLQDGGQLFSYAQQIPATEFLCLYASDFDEKTNLLSIEHQVVSHKDNPKILAEDSKLKSFREATDIKERYKVWKETYKLESIEGGIFEENIPAYTIGKEKYTLADLHIIAEKDIQKKYNEFATILRQYNISGRENAFDKLVNLFLAKIVDEKHNGHHLQFRWRGIASDNYFDFIDRLERLYANGMKEFLKEEVTFVEKEIVIDAFKFFKNDPNATREVVLNHFKRQKYFTNNDFSFIDVHNEKLFYQNVLVLRKMVQMIENIQLNGEQQNQFLGDLFEGFLDRGVKQSEGQFFTPMPIVKFILMALPLEEIVKNSQEIPKAIDYACGAGHFLTELAAQIKPIAEQHKTDVTIKDYYRNLYGIEKEYRLSKVAKVSAFMYSQDDIQIFYRDALVKHEEIREGTFDILVANPPFAVKGFLETLDEEQRKQFSLNEHISDLVKNNNIQCFFLERAKQLLKVGGMAAIIVPTSVLSNTDTTHIATREMLLQAFDFVALVELGSRTFGKTGTNTVVLFLRKKDNNPPPATHYKERVESWFSGRDTDKQKVFDDKHFIAKYCQHLDIKTEDYLPLLTAFDDTTVIEKLLAYDTFKEYQSAFKKTEDKMNEAHQKQVNKLRKELKSKLEKATPAPTATAIADTIASAIATLQAKHEKELQQKLISYLQTIEKDKLYYFVLAATNPQKTLIVKSPADNTEQKKFLGYEWSGAKGSEGIKYLGNTAQKAEENPETEDEDNRIVQNLTAKRVINTPLFDNNDRQNAEKIAYYIQRNFMLEKQYYIDEKKEKVRDYANEKTAPLPLPQHLQGLVSYANVVDLLDFSRKDFNKSFSLTPKNMKPIATKWDYIKIADAFLEVKNGKSVNQIDEVGKYKVSRIETIATASFDANAVKYTNDDVREEDFLQKGDILFSHINSVQHLAKTAVFDLDEKIVHGINLLKFRPNPAILLPKYAAEIFKHSDFTNEIKLQAQKAINQASVNTSYLNELKIPLPPLEIQEKIVLECEAIDKAAEKAKSEVEKAKKEIENKVQDLFSGSNSNKMIDLVHINLHSYDPTQKPDEEFIYVDIDSVEKGTGKIDFSQKLLGKNAPSRARRLAFKNNIVISTVRPYLKGFTFIEKDLTNCVFSTGFAILESKDENILLNKALYFAFMYLSDLMKQMEATMGKAAYPSINKSDIENYKIPIPPLEIQSTLVSEIEKLELQIAENQKIIESVKAEKEAVLKRYL